MISLPRLSGRPFLLALCGLAAFGSLSALAVPRSVGECESLKNDLAYNQCLAMFGPEARNVGGGDGGGGGPAMAAATATPAANSAIPTTEEPVVETRRGRRGRYGRRHGRQVAAFAIASEDGSSTRSHRRRRRH